MDLGEVDLNIIFPSIDLISLGRVFPFCSLEFFLGKQKVGLAFFECAY